MNWYQLETNEIFQKLKSSERGLTKEEVRERLTKYGYNKLEDDEKISKLKIILNQFKSPLIFILLIAVVITAILHEYIDSGVIITVVLLNAVIGYIQEFKAEQSMRALRDMVLPKAKVIRDGKEIEIDSEELVPGDIVVIASGGKIPADLRLFKTIELRMEEAALTGESIPVTKITNPIKSENLTPGDQKNMAFMGTIVVSGRARGLVVETGHKTVLGQIAEQVRTVEAIKTPLQQKLEKFAKIIGIFVLGFSALIFGISVLMGGNITEVFMVAVATAVSAIPEGLPVAVTIAMAIGVAKMAKRNAIVRKLPAVETLGSTTIIGSDKTGTLTKNEMTVKLVFDGEHTYEFTGSGYEPRGTVLRGKLPVKADEIKQLHKVMRIGLLCNESDLYTEADQYKVKGDPTEGALIVSAIKSGLDVTNERTNYSQVAILPFESELGYMATLHQFDNKKIIFIKGSPEQILERCSDCLIEGDLKKNKIITISNQFAMEGLRVLAMAFKEVSLEQNEINAEDVESGLIFAGLQGMIDPPRPEAIKAIEECKQAGIKTIMITGDHAATAVAVAKMLGIGEEIPKVLTGKEIEMMGEDDLYIKVKEVSVFARVSPQHKLLITQQLLKHGEVVAITGDGVNDAPSLKIAHIGVAMGRTGTDVAKETSDIVLTDDNFATIVTAVAEGRVVYDNIKKAATFLISCGLGELIAILVSILAGLPIPYIAAQILWLNLVTNGLQDIALVFEPAEPGIMKRPPRNPKEGFLSQLMIQRILLMGVILASGTIFVFVSRLKAGMPLEQARTAALTTMVFFQFYQALNCRSETQSIFKMSFLKNPFLLFSMVAAFFAQLAVLYVPALQWIFRTTPISLMGWFEILCITITIVFAIEIDKWIRRKKLL